MSTDVRTTRDGPVATVVLDGAERHNVLDRSGWLALTRAVEALSGDDGVRCIVIRGMGGRAFSAGSDIGAFADQRDAPEDVRSYSAAIAAALSAIAQCGTPTLALVEGLCVGGGLEIAAACDLRVCQRSSRFGAPIARLGLTMSYEELAPLVGLLGPGAVLDVLLTGDLLDAERALVMGLVNRVFEDEATVGSAYALAEKVAAGAPLVHGWHKRFVRRLLDPRPLTRDERTEAHEAFGTADYREGRTAFVEKRDPRFRGE